MKYLVDERYPNAEKIRVIQDNLNTHVRASLYKAFEPKEAKRIIAPWSENRNQNSARVDWRFTTADARIKLKRLYPSIQT